MATVNYETDGPSLFDAFTPESFALFEQGQGPLTSNIPEGGSFFRTRPVSRRLTWRSTRGLDVLRRGAHRPSWARLRLRLDHIKPTGRGRVMLRTPSPTLSRGCCRNFLTTEEDCASMVAGVRLALGIAEQEPLQKLRAQALLVPAGDSDEEILAFVRQRRFTVYHPTSTCAIGSVVDPELRVYGTEGLRVADASVMPTITRANTNATAIMIGEKAADLISGRASTTYEEENVR